MIGVSNPRIGLLNVGAEDSKGHDLAQQALTLFRNSPLNSKFIGNVEGRDVHSGVYDVIVTDGFSGNVLLKYAEGVTEFLLKTVQQELVLPLPNDQMAAAKLLKQMAMKYHASAAGGAPLLGIDGVCIKCHGSADERAVTNGLLAAAQEVRVKVNERIVEELAALPVVAEDE
jgi:glycerol-3-phosphate acyltransferase PlsX